MAVEYFLGLLYVIELSRHLDIVVRRDLKRSKAITYEELNAVWCFL